jgi:hypothetical protein
MDRHRRQFVTGFAPSPSFPPFLPLRWLSPPLPTWTRRYGSPDCRAAGAQYAPLLSATSCPDAWTWWLSSSRRVASDTSFPMNQAGGQARVNPGWFVQNHLPRAENAAP